MTPDSCPTHRPTNRITAISRWPDPSQADAARQACINRIETEGAAIRFLLDIGFDIDPAMEAMILARGRAMTALRHSWSLLAGEDEGENAS